MKKKLVAFLALVVVLTCEVAPICSAAELTGADDVTVVAIITNKEVLL